MPEFARVSKLPGCALLILYHLLERPQSRKSYHSESESVVMIDRSVWTFDSPCTLREDVRYTFDVPNSG